MCRKVNVKVVYGCSLNRHQGFLIPLAIFIIAGLSVLAISMMRLSSQSGFSSFREGISAQTFYAAESGLQYAINQVLFTSTTRTQSDAACLSVDGVALNFDVDGLNQCATSIRCSASNNVTNTISYYSLESSASCGVGDLRAGRVIQATVYLDE